MKITQTAQQRTTNRLKYPAKAITPAGMLAGGVMPSPKGMPACLKPFIITTIDTAINTMLIQME